MDTKPVNQANLTVDKNITGAQVNKQVADRVSEQKTDNKRKISSQTNSGVDVELSVHAKELAEAHAKALDLALNTPDVNEDRVKELKEKVRNGTYEINAGGIADGILREAVLDQLAENER